MLRADWQVPVFSNSLTLSTNVCYDQYLLNQINQDLKELSSNDLYLYTNEFLLYQALASRHNVPLSQLSIGFGFGELFSRICDLYREDTFLVVKPTWQYVELLLASKKINYQTFEYEEFFHLDLDLLKKCGEWADILYLANPSGINGTVLEKNDILDLSNCFKLIIVDEAYGDFSTKPSSVIDSVNNYNNIIIGKTFSKSVAMAGLRLGYTIANEELTEKIQDIRPSYSSSSLSTYLGPKLLTYIDDHVHRMKSTRSYLETTYNLPLSNGNYVLFKNGQLDINVETKKVHQDWQRLTLTDISTYYDVIQKK